jgi:Tol biopolymer transport system component
MRMQMTKKRKVILVISLLLVVAVAVAAYMRWQLKQGRRTPPPAGVSVVIEKVAQAAELPSGFVVWSSNRFGNHDILKMDLPQRNITRLTTHPHTEYFPRISPDGRYIVFSRSQKPWVSQRNQELWDVILLDLETGKERLLAKNGNTPTWSSDGRKVYYQHKVFNLAEIDIKTGEQRILFSSGKGDVAKNAGLQTPHYNAETKKMAVTLRYGQHMTAIIDMDGKISRVSDSCQLTWSKQGGFLYHTDHGGKMKNAFYLYDPKTGKSSKWLDLPGEYSHEYFPKLSNDEKYLVFAASKGGHEHDSADYEIFLWQVGTPATSANRLTFHTGNDNWPDVYLED